MTRNSSIQKRAQMGGHSFDASNGDPVTLKRNEIGDFRRALDATLKRRGLEVQKRKRKGAH